MNALFGASWVTSIMGYLFAVITVVQQSMATGSPMPHTVEGWITYCAGLVVAVMGRMAKDGNVSNAGNPIPDAEKVK